MRGTEARQTFGEDATALHGLKPMSFATFSDLVLTRSRIFRIRSGRGIFEGHSSAHPPQSEHAFGRSAYSPILSPASSGDSTIPSGPG